MFKRILLAVALAASLGGAVMACNTPAATTKPSVVVPSTAPAMSPAASDAMMSAEPSAS